MAFQHLSAAVQQYLGRWSIEGITVGSVQACPAMASARRKLPTASPRLAPGDDDKDGTHLSGTAITDKHKLEGRHLLSWGSHCVVVICSVDRRRRVVTGKRSSDVNA